MLYRYWITDCPAIEVSRQAPRLRNRHSLPLPPNNELSPLNPCPVQLAANPQVLPACQDSDPPYKTNATSALQRKGNRVVACPHPARLKILRQRTLNNPIATERHDTAAEGEQLSTPSYPIVQRARKSTLRRSK